LQEDSRNRQLFYGKGCQTALVYMQYQDSEPNVQVAFKSFDDEGQLLA
jgi:hypothetical protein